MIDDDRPTKIPADIYLSMTEKKKRAYVKEQIDHQDAKRRTFLETGRSYADRFHSALRELNDVLDSRAPQQAQPLGSILQEAHGAGRVPAEQEDPATRKAVDVAARLKPSKALEKQNEELKGQTESLSRVTKNKARSAVAMDATHRTMVANDAVSQRRGRTQKLGATTQRFEDACQSAREFLRRRNSCPPTATSQRILVERVTLLKARGVEAKALDKQVRGMQPREEEVKLRDKCQLLEDQVNNQVALIKGL